ncbi:MAG: hypothetical protein E7043_06385 [Lentisphaerae bacterium]|nr:hypothetical protein [Lentisphaerota bacterium]
MKFIFATDIHFFYPNDRGFHPQNKYTEQADIIVEALGIAALEQQAEFIIHAGDLINDGTAPEIISAAAECRKLPIPFYTVLGNHDCMAENFEELWLTHGGELFPEGSLETTFISGNLRFDLLNNSWGRTSPAWSADDGFFTCLAEKQLVRLRSGEQNLPRIIVFHSQICPVYPRQTGWHEEIHRPANDFMVTGSRLIEEFHPLLIAGGHNHINTLEKTDDTRIITASALCEAPFEYKLFEYADGKLSMQTCSLAKYLPFDFEYDETRKFVQGEECDRTF